MISKSYLVESNDNFFIKDGSILFYGENFKDKTRSPYNFFFKCTGKLLFHEKNVGSEASRNIFLNKTYQSGYDAYIYEFKLNEFPNCMK